MDNKNNQCFVEITDELKQRLSHEQYRVLVLAGTEPPFRNKYWNHHEEGIYVDAIDGEPLFISSKKFDSGSGWPSFFEALVPENLVLLKDYSFGMERTEVRARHSGGHLGHLFDDGPLPSGKRYCINSASLNFVPRSNFALYGHAEWEKYW